MKTIAPKMKVALALAIGAILAAGPVMAEKPAWAGAGKGGKDARAEQRAEQNKNERRDDAAKSRRVRPAAAKPAKLEHFQAQHRDAVREYYTEQFRSGRCPPGLAKKQNGCMPPGQAKKWRIGYPLPREVVYYTVPQPLVQQIGPPPSGNRYVRVANDILMIANGSGRVMDAIADLGR